MNETLLAFSLRLQSGTGVVLLAFAGLLGIALLAGWGYSSPLKTGGRFARLLLTLRIAGAGVLALILIDPVVSYAKKSDQTPVVAVLVDTSGSMSVADSVGGRSRAAVAHEILFDKDAGIVAPLAEDFRLAFYTFDTALRPVAGRTLIDRPFVPDGDTTRLKDALEEAVRGVEPGRLAAVVVLTDGRDLSPPSDEPVPATVPVHLVGLGRPSDRTAIRDLAVLEVRAGRRALVANRVQVEAVIRSQGLESMTRSLVLRRDGRSLKSITVTAKPGISSVPLTFIPKEAGTHDYEVALEAAPGETNLDNNRRGFSLTVDARRVRVLYFEGAPRWKYRYLRQALLRDVNLSVTFVVKTGPSRFLQQGDSPVPLRGGLPATRKELNAFDCLILGDLAREDLTADQLRMLHAYVNRDGGGLLFLGGGLAYGPDGMAGTALEEVLPAALDRRGGEVRGTLRIALTREGQSHPALQGVAPFFRGRNAGLFPLDNAYRIGGVKPGAQVLAEAHGAGGTRFTVLVAERFGAGKTVLFASDTDWRWWIERRDEGGERVFSQLWGQILRWLSGREDPHLKRGRSPALLLSRQRVTLGEAVTIQAVGAGIVEASGSVRAPEDEVRALAFAPGEDGLTARFVPRRSGRHEVKATITAKEGPVEREARFVVETDRREMEQTGLDEAELARLAALTGGSVADAATAREIPDRIAREAYVAAKREELHARNTPLFFLALVALFGVEWWIRRRVYGI